MINILIPLAGKESYEVDKKNLFPMLLSDVNGRLLIERAARPYLSLDYDINIIVVAPRKYINEFKLDKILNLIDDRIRVVAINEFTQGALSSCLLAVEELSLNDPIIISSFEQVLTIDLSSIVSNFIQSQSDAGVISFKSKHPKWSYVRINDDQVIESSEKNPISNNAIAGFYYFKTASSFIEGAMNVIRKDVRLNNDFYISSVLNEIILKNGLVIASEIDNKNYYYIRDDISLSNYKNSLNNKNSILEITKKYISFFNDKNIESISNIVSDDFLIIDPTIKTISKDSSLVFLKELFQESLDIHFISRNIYVIDNYKSMIEFSLKINNKNYVGVDILYFNTENKISKLTAYLYEVQIES